MVSDEGVSSERDCCWFQGFSTIYNFTMHNGNILISVSSDRDVFLAVFSCSLE